VLIGGPGTGKSSVLDELERRGFICMSEISREITLEARKKGIEQLFLKEPILFSKLLRSNILTQSHIKVILFFLIEEFLIFMPIWTLQKKTILISLKRKA
jgi:predicted ATPase